MNIFYIFLQKLFKIILQILTDTDFRFRHPENFPKILAKILIFGHYSAIFRPVGLKFLSELRRLLSIDQLWEMKGQYFFADFDLLGRFCWENRRGHHMLSQGSFRSIIITPLGVLFSRVLRTGYSGQWILCNVGIERNN